MNPMNMPGFTGETSLYMASGRDHSPTNRSDSSGGQAVIAQIRAGGGGMGLGGRLRVAGFWCEAACTVTCSVLAGPEAILACMELCEEACDL